MSNDKTFGMHSGRATKNAGMTVLRKYLEVNPWLTSCILLLGALFYLDKLDNEFSAAHPIKYQVVAKLGPVVVDRGITEIQRNMVVIYGMQIKYLETGKLATQWTENKSLYDAVQLNTATSVDQLTHRAYELAGYERVPWAWTYWWVVVVASIMITVAVHYALKWVVNKIEAAV